MSDELRAGLVSAAERFTDDLALGTHDDPHVAFVILVHPDAPPSIVVLAEAGAHRLGRVNQKDPDDNAPDRRGRFFTFEDLEQATDALSAVALAVRMASYRRPDGPFGEYLVAQIAERWHRRRDLAMSRLLGKADEERRRPVVCEGCRRRFTERGHKAHLARNRWCPSARATQEATR